MMGKDSKIAWTDHTFNGWWGCEKVSPGCTNCYAESFAKRVGHEVWGAAGPRRVFPDKHWNDLVKWNAAAEKANAAATVFCSSMADVFEDHPVAAAQRPRLWSYIERTRWLTYLLLTKRPENAADMVPWGCDWPSNVWLGATVEDRERRARLDRLRFIDGPVVKFASCEPLLEDLGDVSFIGIDWVIFGGESGVGRRIRPFDVAWVRNGMERARESGADVFVKQLGAKPQIDGEVITLVHKKGEDMAEWPADLRVQERPAVMGPLVER